MRKVFSILFLTLISFTAMAQEGATKQVQTGPIMTFEKQHHDFGEIIYKDGRVSYEFKFINDGTEPLIISKAKASCGCTVPKYPKTPVMPGEEAVMKVVFNPKGKSGSIRKTVTVTHNSGTPGVSAETKISIGGKIIK